jgi:hypothetical protein
MLENSKLKLRVRELEKKIAKIGGGDSKQHDSGTGGGADEEMNKDLNSDSVMRNLAALTKRVERESEEANEAQRKFKNDLKIVIQEINSYNKQLHEIDVKERGISQSGGNL